MSSRIHSIRIGLLFISLIILSRLFYWQVLSNDKLTSLAQTQRSSVKLIPALRGEIISSDGFSLVTNQPKYTLFAYLPQLQFEPLNIANQLSPLLTPTENLDATESAKPLPQRLEETKLRLLEQLSSTNRSWIPLHKRLDKISKQTIEALDIEGLGFDPDSERFYPEASTSAHLLGFVGRDDLANPQGYFGLEGFYDLELRGRSGIVYQEKDATGKPIVIGNFSEKPGHDGRSLKLHLNRSLQHIVQNHLKKGLEKYGAKAGEVIIMNPHTGAILAMASYPSYDPSKFIDYDVALYKNPAISSFYEPGSILKVLTMAAAIEEGKITPDTRCDDTCNGPVTIGKYTIRTWNDEYFPHQTMTEVLEHSDNTGMIFVAQRLGKDKFTHYLTQFGLGQPTGIDLQEETSPALRQKWGDIDLATASFGQGIAATSLQVIRAIATIANDGYIVQPQVVDQVIGSKTLDIKPKIVTQVISKDTASTVTQMMVSAVNHGDARWVRPKGYQVAGKTGTAQIPIQGHYDEEKTIASFIGFAPASDPQFIMLVKLTEPTSSPWGSETAAPLWFTIAADVLLQLNIPS